MHVAKINACLRTSNADASKFPPHTAHLTWKLMRGIQRQRQLDRRKKDDQWNHSSWIQASRRQQCTSSVHSEPCPASNAACLRTSQHMYPIYEMWGHCPYLNIRDSACNCIGNQRIRGLLSTMKILGPSLSDVVVAGFVARGRCIRLGGAE